MATTDRPRIGVAGADALLEAHLAGGGAAAALRRLGPAVGWAAIRDAVVASERSIVLAERPGGPVLAVKWFAPGAATTIHDHGWAGAALVVEGACRHETYRRAGPTTARLVAVADRRVGELSEWGDPPDDVHRQVGLGAGAIELVLLAGPPIEPADLTALPRGRR